MLKHPGKVTHTKDVSGLLVHSLATNESLEYCRMVEGMARRMGDDPDPPMPLRHCHIQWMLKKLEANYSFGQDKTTNYHLHLTQLALGILISWLVWLRLVEVFSLTEGDINHILPVNGPSVGLPQGLGAVGITLLPATKGNQRGQADVWVAHTTS